MSPDRRLLPHDVKEPLIEVCGRAFWYKQPLFDVFARAGITEEQLLLVYLGNRQLVARVLNERRKSHVDGVLLAGCCSAYHAEWTVPSYLSESCQPTRPLRGGVDALKGDPCLPVFIVAKLGTEGLRRVAKLHFKTTGRVIDST